MFSSYIIRTKLFIQYQFFFKQNRKYLFTRVYILPRIVCSTRSEKRPSILLSCTVSVLCFELVIQVTLEGFSLMIFRFKFFLKSVASKYFVLQFLMSKTYNSTQFEIALPGNSTITCYMINKINLI